MKRILAVLLLAGCVAEPSAEDAPPGIVASTEITVDGVTMAVDQEFGWPRMIAAVNAAGDMVPVESGTADTVIVRGSGGNRDLAIAALAQFCGQAIDPAGFDTQFVFRDAGSDAFWFDGFCQ